MMDSITWQCNSFDVLYKYCGQTIVVLNNGWINLCNLYKLVGKKEYHWKRTKMFKENQDKYVDGYVSSNLAMLLANYLNHTTLVKTILSHHKVLMYKRKCHKELLLMTAEIGSVYRFECANPFTNFYYYFLGVDSHPSISIFARLRLSKTGCLFFKFFPAVNLINQDCANHIIYCRADCAWLDINWINFTHYHTWCFINSERWVNIPQKYHAFIQMLNNMHDNDNNIHDNKKNQRKNICMNLMNLMFDVRLKITDAEYMEIMNLLAKLNDSC